MVQSTRYGDDWFGDVVSSWMPLVLAYMVKRGVVNTMDVRPNIIDVVAVPKASDETQVTNR
jgi:hypothetical protein